MDAEGTGIGGVILDLQLEALSLGIGEAETPVGSVGDGLSGHGDVTLPLAVAASPEKIQRGSGGMIRSRRSSCEIAIGLTRLTLSSFPLHMTLPQITGRMRVLAVS